MNRFYFQEMLSENATLFESVLAFNAPAQGEPAPNAITQQVLERPELRRLLQARAPRQAIPFQTFGDESERLAMMSPEALARLGRILAATVFAEEIANSISRDEVRDARLFLGEDVYNYALVRGRYQIGNLRLLLAPLVKGSLSERCAMLARGIFEEVRAQWPEVLRNRTAQTFATMALPAGEPLKLDPQTRKNLWRFMKKIILRECDKQWTRYFA